MLRHVSCPNCGKIGNELGDWNNIVKNYCDCPKCGERFSWQDLVEHNLPIEDVDRVFN